MYISKVTGLGPRVNNQVSEDLALSQLIKSGLRISTVIDERSVDISLSPDMAKLPYDPKSSLESRKYWMLSDDDRRKVTVIVDRVFREATGIVRKLDPRNPKDLPWIRTWLRLRDYIMGIRAQYTTPASGIIPVSTGPTVRSIVRQVGTTNIEQQLEKTISRLSESPSSMFTSSSNEVSLFRPNHPPFTRTCKIEFALTASREDFWFELSGQYNGNDLRYVKILPLFAKTGERLGQFHITFDGSNYDAPETLELATVAKIRFGFNGSWKPYGSKSIYSFAGFVMIYGNGHFGVVITTSEDNKVVYDYKRFNIPHKNCERLPHTIPPLPLQPKPYGMAIYFPMGKDEVSASEAQRLLIWKNSIPTGTLEKIARGEITITITGYASRPGKPDFNLKLSDGRAQNARIAVQRFFGNNSKVNIQSYGNFDPNWVQKILRFKDPNKYEQVALISFDEIDPDK
jgi:hypothetical protein